MSFLLKFLLFLVPLCSASVWAGDLSALSTRELVTALGDPLFETREAARAEIESRLPEGLSEFRSLRTEVTDPEIRRGLHRAIKEYDPILVSHDDLLRRTMAIVDEACHREEIAAIAALIQRTVDTKAAKELWNFSLEEQREALEGLFAGKVPLYLGRSEEKFSDCVTTIDASFGGLCVHVLLEGRLSYSMRGQEFNFYEALRKTFPAKAEKITLEANQQGLEIFKKDNASDKIYCRVQTTTLDTSARVYYYTDEKTPPEWSIGDEEVRTGGSLLEIAQQIAWKGLDLTKRIQPETHYSEFLLSYTRF